ncbi:MAG TPA: 2Fe-2S iron-sulfur cluster-binding protein [Marmoricola sp.]
MDDVPLPRVTFTNHEGETLTVDARVGESVMQVAKRHGIPGIRAECGGFMNCATCHVYVDPADVAGLPLLSDMEDEMLDGTAADRLDGSRLSCQLPVEETMDLHLTIPDRQL